MWMCGSEDPTSTSASESADSLPTGIRSRMVPLVPLRSHPWCGDEGCVCVCGHTTLGDGNAGGSPETLHPRQYQHGERGGRDGGVHDLVRERCGWGGGGGRWGAGCYSHLST
jgi:hypothetical protein